MNAPPQLSTFADELNDYEDEDEEYEGVEGDVIDQFKDDRDDSSVLAEQLGNHLDLRSPTDPQSPSVEEEKLVDILQQRLFVSREAEDEHVVAESPRYESISPPRNSSMISSLEEFMADRTSRQNSYKQTLDRDAQRVLLKTFSQDQSKTPSISPQRVVQMNNRFRICEEKKTRRLNAKRRETETQENVEYRFAPTINSKSRQLTSDFPTFAERQVTLLAKKRLQRARLEQQREQESRHDRTVDLHESVQTPCICSRGNTNRSENCAMSASPSKGAPVDAVRHSQACMRFMSMCSKMNASFAIHRKKEMMRRSIEDIIAYQDGKKQRQKARAAIQKAKEEKKTTFAPQINAKSEKVSTYFSLRNDSFVLIHIMNTHRSTLR
ncbi:hypothetical protein PHMEG_0001084 [Phytophthora megakarya]|uniref:Uncharacterized protein n=1 Tax=Phytophthora megakarya TaxID=4795 RepID=A0A225X231_9STRA|nr:hypothetical protein PHMEG_0001084 [Phytophthora megakarya]